LTNKAVKEVRTIVAMIAGRTKAETVIAIIEKSLL
jgi:hypothetical protein